MTKAERTDEHLEARSSETIGSPAVSRAKAAAAVFPAITKYELIEELGFGGMATVYRARDPRLKRDVAVKVIHRHLRDSEEMGRRFVVEAHAVAKLKHPCIMEVFDVSTEEETERYLVIELLHGTTLRLLLQKNPEMPAEVGACITLELCTALAHAHARGIIHRDVKPENVMIQPGADPTSSPTREGALRPVSGASPVKLTDFGIAKILENEGMTSTGQVLGSPAHMAPEQIEAGQVDGRADVFALGVLFYECLVGHLPFMGTNPAQVLKRVLEGSYSPVDRERATAGSRWGRIVSKALARDPDQRFATPEAFADAIEAELSTLGISDPRAEIAAFVSDPGGYAELLKARVVPKLLSRGEQARREGELWGAAADFNRALSLSPSDPHILKSLSRLGGMARASRLRRLVAIFVGLFSVGLLVSWGGVRYRRSHLPSKCALLGQGVVCSELLAFTRAGVTLGGEADGGSKALPVASERAPVPSRPSASVVPSAPVRGVRRVKFSITPATAILELDGQRREWMGETFTLPVGPHQIVMRVPNDTCCKPLQRTVQVVSGEGVSDEQRIVLYFQEFHPASVSLYGAPAGAQVRCSSLGLTFSAGLMQEVPMSQFEWTGNCVFMNQSSIEYQPRQKLVSLRAGERVRISWSE